MRTIELTQGAHATIDDNDYELVMNNPHRYPYQRTTKIHWRAEEDHTRPGFFYAVALLQDRPYHRTKIRLHRWILGAPKGSIVDHVNGNGLDNRRENIRICTQSQNSMNSRTRESQYPRGVTMINGGYVARLAYDGNREYLGYFKTIEEATTIYKLKQEELCPEYVYKN